MASIDAYRDWWRPDFFAAMKLLASMGDALAAQGEPRPVLVDDAAVEFYSRSKIPAPTVDLLLFDPLPGAPEIDAELQRHGFVPTASADSDAWAHPSTGLAFRVVGSAMLIPLAKVDRFSNGMLAAIGIDVIGLEDAIGFLVRRWWSEGPAAQGALDQAATLFLCWSAADGDRLDLGNYDPEYLDWCLRNETNHCCGWPLLEEAVLRKLRGQPMPSSADSPAGLGDRSRTTDFAGGVQTTLEEARKILGSRLKGAPNDGRKS